MDPKNPKSPPSAPQKKPKPQQWLKGIIFLLGLTVVLLVFAVIVLGCLVYRARSAANEAKMARLEAIKAQEASRMSREEQMRLEKRAEETEHTLKTAKQEAERAQDKSREVYEEAASKVEKAEIDSKTARKDAEEAKKTAEQKREDAKAAQVVAAQAEANAEKARKIPIVGDLSRFVDTGRSAWENYLNKANKSYSDFKVGVKDRNRAFIKGIKTSGSRKFDDTRKFLPRIQSEALTDEVVRSLVVAATKDAISNDKQNTRLTNEIKKLIVGANFIPLCKASYEKLYDDGRMLEDYYNRELSKFKANLVQKRIESGLTTDIGTKTEKHTSDFPKQIPPSIQETIDKSSTAVARLVLRLGKAEISEMRKVFDRNGDPKKVDVSALRTKLGPKVEKELGAIVDKLQAKALDDVIQKANRSFSNSIKEGEQFFRDATRIQR